MFLLRGTISEKETCKLLWGTPLLWQMYLICWVICPKNQNHNPQENYLNISPVKYIYTWDIKYTNFKKEKKKAGCIFVVKSEILNVQI